MEAREKGRLSPKELTLDDGDTAYTLERVVKAEEEDVTEAGMEDPCCTISWRWRGGSSAV